MVAQAHGSADLGEGGAGGAAGGKSSGAERSTQNTQYDQIGTRYLEIKVLPAAQPEVPSILNALGGNGVMGKKCLGMLIDSFSHKLYTMTLAVLHFARRVSLSSFEASRHVSANISPLKKAAARSPVLMAPGTSIVNLDLLQSAKY